MTGITLWASTASTPPLLGEIDVLVFATAARLAGANRCGTGVCSACNNPDQPDVTIGHDGAGHARHAAGAGRCGLAEGEPGRHQFRNGAGTEGAARRQRGGFNENYPRAPLCG